MNFIFKIKEFIPCFVLAQFADDKHLEYLDFDQCVDEYFSQAEKQKLKQKLDNKEQAIFSKVVKIQEDQEKRIMGL